MPERSWIGMLIPVVKFYSLQKALATIRKGESPSRWFTKGMSSNALPA